MKLAYIPSISQSFSVGEHLTSFRHEAPLPPQFIVLEIEVDHNEIGTRLEGVFYTLNEIIQRYDQQSLLAFTITTPRHEDALMQFFATHHRDDDFVISANRYFLKDLHHQFPLIRGVYDARQFRGTWMELVDSQNESDAYLVLLEPTQLKGIDVRKTRTLGLRIWLSVDTHFDPSDIAIYGNVIYGVFSSHYEHLYRGAPRGGIKSVATIAHRGVPFLYPENSLGGFKHALQMGADIIECDIHTTRDKQLIINHDDSSDRTGSSSFVIRSTPLNDLLKVTLKRHNGVITNETIPSLEQLLRLLKTTDAVAFIEIKDEDPHTVHELIRLIHHYQVRHQVLIISFISSQLTLFHSSLPQVTIGWLNDVVKEGDSELEALVKILTNVCPLKSNYNPYFGVITSNLVAQLHLRGIPVWPWTIDDKDDMQLMLASGVDGITSNDLQLLQSVVEGSPYVE